MGVSGDSCMRGSNSPRSSGMMARGKVYVWTCKRKLDEGCGMLPGRDSCVLKAWIGTYKMVCGERQLAFV